MEKCVKVELNTGLQSRSASQFVQEANRFRAHLILEKGEKQVNAKSIMGLMSLAVSPNETIKLIADGDDEEKALNELIAFVSRDDQEA